MGNLPAERLPAESYTHFAACRWRSKWISTRNSRSFFCTINRLTGRYTCLVLLLMMCSGQASVRCDLQLCLIMCSHWWDNWLKVLQYGVWLFEGWSTVVLFSAVVCTRCRSWLRHCITSWKIEGSIPDSVFGILHCHNLSGRTLGLVDSDSNKNEHQEYFLGGKGGRCVRLTTLPPSCASNSWNPQGLLRPLQLFVR